MKKKQQQHNQPDAGDSHLVLGKIQDSRFARLSAALDAAGDRRWLREHPTAPYRERPASMRELLAYILAETGRHRWLMTVPMWLARLQAAVLEHLPGKLLTRDQLLMLQRDNVVTAGAPGLAELGIVPTPIDLVVPAYLRRFRPGGGRRADLAPA